MAIRKRTNAYWARRANERLVESEKTSDEYRKKVRRVYGAAQRDVLRQLKRIYVSYWSKDEGFDKQKLKTLTSAGDMRKFVAELKKYNLYDRIPDNYKGRISRLEALNAQFWLEAHKAGLKQDELVTDSNRKVYEESYYRSVFDVSKGIGSTPSFNMLDKATVDKALETKFSGKNYSERIWGNSDILAKQLSEKLAVAIATGQSIEKTARQFRERFSVQNYYAERLIRTETNYFHNSAEIESYKSMGFEYFQFLATLDNRTSEICQEMDGKKFKVSEGMPGDNVPPLHPNCRSTIVPYFKGYEPEIRIYRDPKTGKNKYTYNMNYKTWAKKYKNPPVRTMASTRKQQTIKIHTGRIVGARTNLEGKKIQSNNQKIRNTVNELLNMDTLAAKKMFDIMTLRQPSILITNFNKSEISKYSKIAEQKIVDNATISFKRSNMQHLIRSGHITGVDKDGKYVRNKLTAKDLTEIKLTIKHPDLVKKTRNSNKNPNNHRLQFEKTIDNHRHRLILEVDAKSGKVEIITYFNT